MRHVFFSFHHDDSWRTNQIRNLWVAHGTESIGFNDSAEFETVNDQRKKTIQNWIDNQIKGTSVTIVLIGSDTLNRPWVKYEIEQSIRRGNGLLGIHINQLKGKDKKIKRIATTNNLDKYNPTGIVALISPPKYETKMLPITHFGLVTAHEYIRDNIGDWVEEAARRAGR